MDCTWPRAALIILALISCAAATTQAASDSSASADRDEVAAMVDQLGSPSFAEREHATRELLRRGIATREALESAAKSPDAEVRSRARTILGIVSDADFRDRLEAFAADYDGRARQSLPGWERVSQQLGNSRLTRQLFVEMQRAEPELMAGFALGGKAASDALDARARTIFEQLSHTSGGDGPISLGTVASMLLVGAADDVTIEEQLSFQLYTWLLYRPTFQKNASSGPWSGPLKRLLGMWIAKDTTPAATAQNLIFAANYELKPEGLSLAAKLLANDSTSPQLRQFALLTIGRFGDKQQISTVEKYLQDATACGAIQLNRLPRQVEVQVRDVALAVLLHLTGQPGADYGASRVEPNPQAYFQVAAIVFPTPAARNEALKRWQAWRGEHPQP